VADASSPGDWLDPQRHRTCVDAVEEAAREAAELRGHLDGANVAATERLITAFLALVGRLGREVEDEGESAGRTRLRELQWEFASMLEQATGEPVRLPRLRPYIPERLRDVTDEDMKGHLRGREPRLIGLRYIAGPDRRRPSKLQHALLIDCRFEGVDFSGSQFGPQTFLVRTRFVNCQFDGASAGGLRASSLVFDGCSFTGAVFEDCTFGESVFRNRPDELPQTSVSVHFERSTFSYCRLDGLQIPGANISDASFTNCVLDGSDMSGGIGEGAVFCESSLGSCDLGGMNLTNSVFRNCDLRAAKFVSAAGKPAILGRADLETAFHLSPETIADPRLRGALWPRDSGLDPYEVLKQELRATIQAPDTVERGADGR
jgi:uncharacterized protein YjbI with pentapeptide repeats